MVHTKFKIDLTPYQADEKKILFIQITTKKDLAIMSALFSLRILSKEERATVQNSIDNIGIGNSALSKIVMGTFFEENDLLLDALTSYEEAIEQDPNNESYREMRDEFLIRNGMF